MPIVKYPDYRSYERLRVQTNDTMMGLLVGSKIAAATLELTAGSSVTLSRMFPGVDHIRRFDHKADTAREVLSDAEPLLGAMAVPYVLGLQEDLFVSMLTLLNSEPTISVPDLDNTRTANMHRRFEAATNTVFDADDLELFSLVRVMRNTHIHNGGKANAYLAGLTSNLSQNAQGKWQGITGGPAPSYAQGDEVSLGLPELIAILAISKKLSDKANEGLQTALPRSAWLRILQEDWLAATPSPQGNPEQRLKKIRGYARTYYAPLNFSESEVKSIS